MKVAISRFFSWFPLCSDKANGLKGDIFICGKKMAKDMICISKGLPQGGWRLDSH
jgi:hypothetical protein